MASISLSTCLDTFDSKKSPFFTGRCSFSSISIPGCVHGFSRLNFVQVSRVETTELSDNGPGLSNQGLIERNKEFGTRIKRKYKNAKKKKGRDVWFKLCNKRVVDELESKDLCVDGSEFGVDYSLTEMNLSLEQCNYVLRQLEECGADEKTLRFFEWMRKNGKLDGNIVVYNLVLRVLGRRGDWDSAEKVIREAAERVGSDLDFRVFNTLIYACSKQGDVKLSGKWFRMMLELGVRPNVATFGMLMGLYQKGWNVEEAEFVFAQMRNSGVVCESAYSAMITIYTRLGLYDKAEHVIGLMKEDEVVLNLENWLVLLNAYCQQGKLKEANRVFLSMQEAGFSPNIVAYNTLITGYGKVSNMAATQSLFEDIQNTGLKPEATTYRSMIEGWGRSGNYVMAEKYYKELKWLGFMPNSSNLYTLINLQAEHGHEEGARRTLDDMLKLGCQCSSIIGTLLKAYERAGRIDKIPLLLNGSLYQHILVNQSSCSSLVIAYVKHGLVNDAIKVLEDKRWKDQAFEDNLHHLLICSCKESGHLEDAIKIYSRMQKFASKPNLHIACTMIDIYTLMGQYNKGEKIYLNLKSSGIALDMVAFSITVRMYVKAGSLKDACSVLETMEKQEGIVPDIYLYRDMLRIYQQCNMTDKLKSLYYKILKAEVVWDQELYNCVINCCSRALPVDELSRLFDEMLLRGYSPNNITINVMLDVYGKSKLLHKAKDTLVMARKRGLIDVVSYNTVIAAYGRKKDFKNMAATVRNMQFDGFSVSLEAYNCMLDAYGKEGQMESFQNVLRRIKQSSFSSDSYTYNIMINIYGEQGWINEVLEVLRELKDCKLGPDLCGYNTLIKAFGIAGMVEDAVKLIAEMRENGIQPDKVTYTNLINVLQRNDNYLEAVKWSLWMKQMGL